MPLLFPLSWLPGSADLHWEHGYLNTYGAHNVIGMFSVASLLVGGASVSRPVGQAIVGTLLFNSMFIMSPEIGKAVSGQAILGEYFRTFMVYGVIGGFGVVWNANESHASLLILMRLAGRLIGGLAMKKQRLER